MLDAAADAPTVYVIDDDHDLAGALARLLAREGYAASPFTDPAQVLAAYGAAPAMCVITDIMMGDLDGFSFADQVRTRDPTTAIIFMTAWPTTAHAVDAIRRFGGLDYLDKPLDLPRLLLAVREGVAWSRGCRARQARLARLTAREREVFSLLIKGLSSKAIAAELGLSPKTVEDHRAQISAKTGTSGLAQLIALSGTGRP